MNTNDSTTWRFRALDTLFFRDARPHGSAGAAVLGSLFPPSARTVAGAIRFLIGNSLGVDWGAFATAVDGRPFMVSDIDLLSLMGRGDHYGLLRLTGPWLSVRTAARSNSAESARWQRLYPAPRLLLQDDAGTLRGRLQLGPVVDCDLGRIRLPVLPERGLRSADRVWLDADAYAAALRGDAATTGTYRDQDLRAEEPRLGIARNLDRHSAEHGLLYQTRHVRPFEGARALAIETDVGGHEAEALPHAAVAPLVRLGGEGRLAGVDRDQQTTPLPNKPDADDRTTGLTIILLTPADLDGGWLPPGFQPTDSAQGRTWTGRIAGIDLTLHSAVIGPTIREGGWDLAARMPRAVRSLVPAGSAWYATVHDAGGGIVRGPALAAAIHTLHGKTLTNDPLGRGQIAVGLLDSTTFPTSVPTQETR